MVSVYTLSRLDHCINANFGTVIESRRGDYNGEPCQFIKFKAGYISDKTFATIQRYFMDLPAGWLLEYQISPLSRVSLTVTLFCKLPRGE
jgi:hypothetical protein